MNEPSTNRSTLVLLSGGLDSSILVRFLAERGERVCAAFFDFGQSSAEFERTAVHKVWETMPSETEPLLEISLKGWRDSFKDAEKSMPSLAMGFLPRNAILCLTALPIARKFKCRWIAIGSTSDDAGMPDSDESFAERLNQLLKSLLQQERVAVPWLWEEHGWDKSQIVSWARDHLAPDFIGLTHSCYRPKRDKPECGTCGACQKRLKAIQDAAPTQVPSAGS